MAVKSKPTPAKKSKAKSGGKLSRFFSNPKNVIIVVFVLGFAGVGAYKVYQSSAYTQKAPNSVSNCYTNVTVNGTMSQSRGTHGGCTLYLKNLLNKIRTVGVHNTDTQWPGFAGPGTYCPLNDKYDACTGSSVQKFQKFMNDDNNNRLKTYTDAYGKSKVMPDISPTTTSAGTQTWNLLLVLCANQKSGTSLRSYCGI